MSTINTVIAAVVICLAVTGCDIQRGGGFGSTDKEFMADLKDHLNQAGIVFTEEDNGLISYSPKFNEEVDLLIEKVRKRRATRSSFQVDDEESLKFITNLMTEKGHEFKLVTSNGTSWVVWHPIDEEQKQSIMVKYVEYQFRKRHR